MERWEVTRLCIKIIRKREEKRMKESEEMHFHDMRSTFLGEWKANRKVASSSILWRSIDRICSSFPSHFILHLSFYFSLIILKTPRAILSTNAISATERKREKETRERKALEWIPQENSMFFWWRSIITRARTRSISGYFKLLTRRDIPEGAETLSWLSSGKFRTTDRKLIRRARIKTKAECWRQWTRRSETVETRDAREGSSHYSRVEFYEIAR